MKSTDLSRKLTAVGHVISPETVRKDWSLGAPRASAEAYLKWRERRKEHTDRGDPVLRKLKAQKLRGEIALLEERHRAERRENQVKADELVSRVWCAERFHAYGGALEAVRLKSEAEHPLLFAAAAGDVAKCREVIMRIWDEILAAASETIGRAFDESKPCPTVEQKEPRG